MIVQINGCNDVRVIDTADDDVRVVTPEALLPYLPGIVRLLGLGRVHGRIVELDQNWPGWNPGHAERPQSAAIVTATRAAMARRES